MSPQIIWASTLDNRYEVQVVRLAPYIGKLTIRDDGEEIFSQQIGLSYGAVFGPDVSDIAGWQKIAANFIDNK
jgi:hypothetical protein